MNSDRFEEFHRRQAELGACRCPECRGNVGVATAAADLRAPGTGVADGHPGDRAAAAAPYAPLDPDDSRWFAPFGPTHGYSAWEDAFKPGWASSYTKRWPRDAI